MKLISYWVLPVISGIMWLATLLGLLLYWILVTDRTHYASMSDTQTIAYISDVGASRLKPLFVFGCIVTTIFLDLSFAADRWLRHKGRLAPNISIWEKVFFGLSIVFAIAGTVGLTCLSGFDTLHYPRLHILFLCLFIGGYLLSAIFICAEFQRLGKKYRQHRSLTISFWAKIIFIFVELGLLVAFGVTMTKKHYSISAILEWIISFIFSFYVFSFVIDLLPAMHTRKGQQPYSLRPMNTLEAREMRQSVRRQDPLPRATQESDRTLTNNQNRAPLGPKPRDF